MPLELRHLQIDERDVGMEVGERGQRFAGAQVGPHIEAKRAKRSMSGTTAGSSSTTRVADGGSGGHIDPAATSGAAAATPR